MSSRLHARIAVSRTSDYSANVLALANAPYERGRLRSFSLMSEK